MRRNLVFGALLLLALASCSDSAPAPSESAYVPDEPQVVDLPVIGTMNVPRCRAVASQTDGALYVVASVPEGWLCPSITLSFDRSPDAAVVEGRLDWVRIEDRESFQWAATPEAASLRLEPATSRDALGAGTWTAKIAMLRNGERTPVLKRAVCEEQRAGN